MSCALVFFVRDNLASAAAGLSTALKRACALAGRPQMTQICVAPKSCGMMQACDEDEDASCELPPPLLLLPLLVTPLPAASFARTSPASPRNISAAFSCLCRGLALWRCGAAVASTGASSCFSPMALVLATLAEGVVERFMLTTLERPLFQRPIEERRGMVPGSGGLDWKKVDDA